MVDAMDVIKFYNVYSFLFYKYYFKNLEAIVREIFTSLSYGLSEKWH